MSERYSETQHVQMVLVQPPLDVQPLAMALFMEAEEPYRPQAAQEEVLRLIDVLNEQGAEVITVRDALLRGSVEELRELVEGWIDCKDATRREQVRSSLAQMTAQECVELLFLRPSLRLIPDLELSQISPDAYYEEYQVAPLFGLMFVRDHFILTNRGLILGNFRRRDRRGETQVMALALRNLGLHPIHAFQGTAFLEGGDFTTTETISFIAHGMRTNMETIEEMFQRDLFGTPSVVVMEDLAHDPEEFHLDHYFNLLTENLVAISEVRLQPTHLQCHLYQWQEGAYVQVAERLSFGMMCERLSLRYLTMPKTEMSKMGVNFLNLGGHRLLCTAHMPQLVVDRLHELGFETEQVKFHEMHKQYGSLHCATQTLRRDSSCVDRQVVVHVQSGHIE